MQMESTRLSLLTKTRLEREIKSLVTQSKCKAKSRIGQPECEAKK